MDSLTILGTTINQDEHGRYSINDLHKAAGGEARHRPVMFLRLKDAKRAKQLLINEAELKGTDQYPLPVSRKTGRNGGTWICMELVYKYAMWISGEFELNVIRTFHAMTIAHSVQQRIDSGDYMHNLELAQGALNKERQIASEGARTLGLWSARKAKAEGAVAKLIDECQLKIKFD